MTQLGTLITTGHADSVTCYLETQGFSPKRQGFLGSDFILGYTLNTSHFSLTYRLENDGRLILCDLAAIKEDGQALAKVTSLLHQIERAVPQVKWIDALILPASDKQPELKRKRERLAHYFQKQGAYLVEQEDGQMWWRYECTHLLKQ